VGAGCQVRVTPHFRRTLGEVEAFLCEAGAGHAFDVLLDDLADKVIPNLAKFPEMGRDFMARSAGSIEVSQGLEGLRNLAGAMRLREYSLPPYLLLYATTGQVVHLLAIRHHRQLSFDFAGLWGV
jgi:plasmid stabilization system protein ParE